MLLLSERTLNALIGLGAFLILAAAFAISLLPRGVSHLDPAAHILVVLGTTVGFYASGLFVQLRLRLVRPGAALLGIGAAFIPLAVWLFGREDISPAWEPGTVWLMASLLSLPTYACSYRWLRDRPFALLTTLAGVSVLLAGCQQLGVPAPWSLCALVTLAGACLLAVRPLRVRWGALAWALFWTAQLTTPLVMAVLLALRALPAALHTGLLAVWPVLDAGDATVEYAIGGNAGRRLPARRAAATRAVGRAGLGAGLDGTAHHAARKGGFDVD
jgi:hypothetical protein